MLLIACPWCGPREETEFSCGGEAHIARPADPDALSDEQWGDYLFMRKNPRGAHLEQWVHAHGCRRWFNVRRDTVTYRITAVYKLGEAPPEDVGSASEPDLPLARRRPHRPPHAAPLHVQRQALRGARRRHARLRAARQRRQRRRAELEIPPAARHRRLRRRGAQRRSCSSKPAPATVPNARATEVALYDGLVASSVNAWPSVDFDLMAVAGLFARFMPAGFYYKTFMWPKRFWMTLRALHPQGLRPRHRARPSRIPTATTG